MAMEHMDAPHLPDVWQPKDPGEAWSLKRQYGASAGYVSGATLLRTQWENGVRPLPRHLISLESIQEMRGVRMTNGKVSIGALMTLNECRGHPIILEHAAIVAQAMTSIAAPSVRHMATLGGNIASLVGDAIPALLALDAEVILYRDNSWRAVPLRDWIHSPHGERCGDDLICRVLLPSRAADSEEGEAEGAKGEDFSFYGKTGRREAFTPSLVTIAASGHTDGDGVVSRIRLTAGGGSALPDRLPDAEAAINGFRLSPEMLVSVHELIKRQYAAAGDLFADSNYRKEASANMITAQLWKLLKSKSSLS